MITCVYSAEKRTQLQYVGRRYEQLCKRCHVLYKTSSFSMFITTKDSYTCIKTSYYFYYTTISELNVTIKASHFSYCQQMIKWKCRDITFWVPIWHTLKQEIGQSNGPTFNINRKESFSYLTIPRFVDSSESYKHTRVLIFLYILHFTKTFKNFN
jgi:hypothetical protein